MKLTAFLLLMASPDWLQLDRTTRRDIAQTSLAAAFPDESATLRFYDAEAFSARVSDVAVIEADTPQTYYFAMERLRDTPLIANGYFQLKDIIPAYENGFQEFERAG